MLIVPGMKRQEFSARVTRMTCVLPALGAKGYMYFRDVFPNLPPSALKVEHPVPLSPKAIF